MRALSILALCLGAVAYAQEATPQTTVAPAPNVLAQMLGRLAPRELGPTTMGGRIMDIDADPKAPRRFYVAFASGGLWKTETAGTVMTPVFDRMPTQCFGAVAIDPNAPNTVWAATGEASSRNSTSWGGGVYKSSDGGETWNLTGLTETEHVGRIAVNPKDSRQVLVAALGRLWGENPDRGIYKTKDGGATWNKVLDVGPKAGGVDVVFDPKNPKVVMAATWQRQRMAYNFYSRGPGSGLWRSTDGGDTWKRVTGGIPEGDLGRIGIAVMHNNPKIWVATIDAKEGGVYRSTDGGQNWAKVNTLNPRPFYFSRPVQDPQDENRIYLCGVNVHYSDDAGKTFRTMNMPVHPDHHAMWINPQDNNHLILGNDGGLAQSYDRGKTWKFINNMAVGQFYAVSFDFRKPYYVYGGLQDNGCWAGPTQTRTGGATAQDWISIGGGDGFYAEADWENWQWVYTESQGGALGRLNQLTGESKGIRPRAPRGETYRFNWNSPLLISPHNSATLYFGGNRLFKSVNRGDAWDPVSPDLTTNDPEKLKPPVGDAIDSGAEKHCTIVTIGESPKKRGVLWAGTDDGNLQVSENDGATWTNVRPNVPGVPEFTWVSRVEPSRYEDGRCYVTFDGHRNDDKNPYVYVTEDYGKTWKALTAGLPPSAVAYVVREGTKNPDFLALGTERGLYFSLDRGATWEQYTAKGWPIAVRVDDVRIHPRELDLVVATHGRSLWTVPISALEQLTKENREKDVFVCAPQTVYLLGRVNSGAWGGTGDFQARNTQPGTVIYYWLKEATQEKVEVYVRDAAGKEIARLDGKGEAGLNAIPWSPARRTSMQSTDYGVSLKIGDKVHQGPLLRIEDLSVKSDPNNAIGQ
ncbi:MAG: hypothetical protein KIT11_00750 [Fimbriimonadaceae bacterium]|nr:hypothetical protein [Fimbriimonadaceae bacterium]QYK55098.1 MAG: hypothetical protein KF733_08785 [Fimbriimonadaceae bacterium]